MPADQKPEQGVYPQYKNLMKAVEAIGLHDHLCLIYETPEEQFAAIVPFVRYGLERGEKCIYVADDNTSAEVLAQLESGGVDINKALKAGALSVITKKDAYLKQGFFDPDWMIRFLKEASDEAKAQGFKGLRVTGEMTWVLGGDYGSDRLIEYESKLNYFFPENDALAICQYNLGRFTPEIIMDVIRTHPLVIYRGQVCRNFYYTSPEEMLLPNQGYLELSRLLYNILERERLEELNKRSEDGIGTLEVEVEEAQRIGRTGYLEWNISTGDASWSGGACRMFGLDPGMPLPDFKRHLLLYSAGSAKSLEEAAEASKKTGQPFELDLDLAQGPQRWVIARGGVRKAPDGRITGLRLALIEMTGRARFGTESSEPAGYLFGLAEAMDSVVFWVFSASPPRFEYVNRAFEKIWGKKREELLSDPKLWAAAVHPDDRGAVNSCLEQLTTGVKDAYSAEFRVIRPDGSVRWVRGQAVRLALARDGHVLVAGAAEDITERKTAADALKTTGEELQQAPGSAKRLIGLLPICAYCKKIRDDKGSWESLEKFIRERSGAEFTHCICPECAERFAKKDIGMA